MRYIKNVQGCARKRADPEIFTEGWLPQTERNEHQGVLCFIETNVFCLCQQSMASVLKWRKMAQFEAFLFPKWDNILFGLLRLIMNI